MGPCPHLDLPQTTIELIFQLTAPPTGRLQPDADRQADRPSGDTVQLPRDQGLEATGTVERCAGRVLRSAGRAVGRRPAGTIWPRHGKPAICGCTSTASAARAAQRTSTHDTRNCRCKSARPRRPALIQCDCAVAQVAIYDRVLSEESIARHVDALSWGRERREALLQAAATTGPALGGITQAAGGRRVGPAYTSSRGPGQATGGSADAGARPDPHLSRRVPDGHQPAGGRNRRRTDPDQRRSATAYLADLPELRRRRGCPTVSSRCGRRPDRRAPVVRALQTVGEGPFQAMKSLSFSGEYPFGWYTFEEPALPIQVRMEVFSPLVPLNTKDSSIPCAIFNLTAKNAGPGPVSVSFLATQRNPIGLPKGAYGGNTNRVLHGKEGVLVHLNSSLRQERSRLRRLGVGDAGRGCGSDCRVGRPWSRWPRSSAATGSVTKVVEAGPTPAGQTADAAIAVPFVLPPGDDAHGDLRAGVAFPEHQFSGRESPHGQHVRQLVARCAGRGERRVGAVGRVDRPDAAVP